MLSAERELSQAGPRSALLGAPLSASVLLLVSRATATSGGVSEAALPADLCHVLPILAYYLAALVSKLCVGLGYKLLFPRLTAQMPRLLLRHATFILTLLRCHSRVLSYAWLISLTRLGEWPLGFAACPRFEALTCSGRRLSHASAAGQASTEDRREGGSSGHSVTVQFRGR